MQHPHTRMIHSLKIMMWISFRSSLPLTTSSTWSITPLRHHFLPRLHSWFHPLQGIIWCQCWCLPSRSGWRSLWSMSSTSQSGAKTTNWWKRKEMKTTVVALKSASMNSKDDVTVRLNRVIWRSWRQSWEGSSRSESERRKGRKNRKDCAQKTPYQESPNNISKCASR